MDFKNVISVLILRLSLHIIAQDTPGNLQFNRVVIYNSEFNQGTPNSTSSFRNYAEFNSITIPQGKVWKIESVVMYERRDTSSNPVSGRNDFAPNIYGPISPWGASAEHTLQLNDIPVFIYQYIGNYSESMVKYPIWLPSGEYIPHSWEAYTNNQVLSEFTIYALEFNIIP
jgi:outer membrane lipoprotein-sorting protein